MNTHTYHPPCGRMVSATNGFTPDGECRVCRHSYAPSLAFRTCAAVGYIIFGAAAGAGGLLWLLH